MLRPITTTDIGFIFGTLLRVVEESPRYAKTIVDEQYICSNLKSMIERPDFIGCIDTDSRGYMFGICGSDWFDIAYNAYERLLYILPDHRGGILAARLIKRFELLARERGCLYVRAGSSTEINTENTLKLYERLGYTRDGAGVSKRIN